MIFFSIFQLWERSTNVNRYVREQTLHYYSCFHEKNPKKLFSNWLVFTKKRAKLKIGTTFSSLLLRIPIVELLFYQYVDMSIWTLIEDNWNWNLINFKPYLLHTIWRNLRVGEIRENYDFLREIGQIFEVFEVFELFEYLLE